MNLFQRFQDTFGFTDPYDPLPDEEDTSQVAYSDGYEEESLLASSPPRTNVIGVPIWAGAQMEVAVFTPRSFEEIPQTVTALRQRKSVVLNLSLLDPDQAQRCADYVAGGTYAIDGHQERLSESIFLFTPSSVHINNYPLPNPEPIPSVPSPSVLVPRPAPSPRMADLFPEANPF